MILLYILLAILLLGVLISVHEFGHFISARMVGIAVKEFSIGFGPKILQRKSKKHETLFTLRIIPVGGYCMYYGDTDDDPDGEKANDPRNFSVARLWKRIFCVISGPLMNFILAFVVAIGLMAIYGITIGQPYVSSVEPGMPAEAAGLLPGDQFLRVGEHEVHTGGTPAVVEAIDQAAGNPFSVAVQRGSEALTFTLSPLLDEEENRYRIGIMISSLRPLQTGEIIPAAWDACVFASGAIIDALGKMVTTGEGFNETTGPVGIVQLVAEQTQRGGLEVFMNLFVIISINLGLMNLLPIPGLDGSRIVFMLIEGIRRKPVSQRTEANVHLCGYALLLGLMLFFTFRDVTRLFGF